MYTKSLRPFKKLFTPGFVSKRYPEFEKLIDSFLKYMDEKNPLDFWEAGTTDESDNSYYKNIVNLNTLYYIEDLPVKNTDLLAAYISDFARTLEFRNPHLGFDLEVIRDICNDSNIIFRLKGCYTAFNFFIHHIYDAEICGMPYSQTLLCKFTAGADFDGTIAQLPNHIAIADGQSVLTEIPGYAIEDNILTGGGLDVIRQIEPADGAHASRQDIIAADKGAHPFHYQIVTKSELFKTGNFVRNLLNAFNPAGFHCEIFVKYDDIDCPIYADMKDFSHYTYQLECTRGTEPWFDNEDDSMIDNTGDSLRFNEGDRVL